MVSGPQPSYTLYITFTGTRTGDDDEYSVYTNPDRIPERAIVHVYQKINEGIIEPRKLKLEKP
jgi:hypothetical protein